MDTIIHHYNEILPGLFLGNKYASYLRDFDLIINCTPDLNIDKPCIRFPIDDCSKYAIDYFYQMQDKNILHLIHYHLNTNKTVLVHCAAGIQRSATLVASYLIKYFGIDKFNAIQFIKNKRPIAFTPVVNFDLTLSLIEHKYLGFPCPIEKKINELL